MTSGRGRVGGKEGEKKMKKIHCRTHNCQQESTVLALNYQQQMVRIFDEPLLCNNVHCKPSSTAWYLLEIYSPTSTKSDYVHRYILKGPSTQWYSQQVDHKSTPPKKSTILMIATAFHVLPYAIIYSCDFFTKRKKKTTVGLFNPARQ